MVKANWDKEKLSENWTLLPTELNLVGNKVSANHRFYFWRSQSEGFIVCFGREMDHSVPVGSVSETVEIETLEQSIALLTSAPGF